MFPKQFYKSKRAKVSKRKCKELQKYYEFKFFDLLLAGALGYISFFGFALKMNINNKRNKIFFFSHYFFYLIF